MALIILSVLTMSNMGGVPMEKWWPQAWLNALWDYADGSNAWLIILWAAIGYAVHEAGHAFVICALGGKPRFGRNRRLLVHAQRALSVHVA